MRKGKAGWQNKEKLSNFFPLAYKAYAKAGSSSIYTYKLYGVAYQHLGPTKMFLILFNTLCMNKLWEK